MDGEDVPALHHSTGEVAAVLALYCDVLCAAELGLEGCRVLAVPWCIHTLGEHTMRSACKEEEHLRERYALQLCGECSVADGFGLVAVDRAEVVRRGGAMRELWDGEARVL